MSKMNTCATCKYWRHIRDEDYKTWPGPHGQCQLFDEDSQDQLAWLSGIVAEHQGVSFAEDLSLITKPEFGCNQWKGVGR